MKVMKYFAVASLALFAALPTMVIRQRLKNCMCTC